MARNASSFSSRFWSVIWVASKSKQFGKPKHYQLVKDDPRNQKLVEGICLEYENGLLFGFNCWGESYSRPLRPDFSLHYQLQILLLDAKYKGEREGFYGETGNGLIESWKEEDIIKMHAYRDAIANVVGAFVLYPGRETVFFRIFNAARCCQGVGAVALQPSTDAKPEGTGYQKLRTLIQEFIGMDGASTNSSDLAQQDRTILR